MNRQHPGAGGVYRSQGRRYLHVNRAYREWMGIPPDAMLGGTVGEVLRDTLGEPYCEQVRPGFERALRGERVTIEAEGCAGRCAAGYPAAQDFGAPGAGTDPVGRADAARPAGDADVVRRAGGPVAEL
jgi:hypothetical protein